MKKKIPKFKNEDEERGFWATHDSTEFIDWKKAKKVLLSNLKPSVKTISLRLPKSMLEELKLLANKRDVPLKFPEMHILIGHWTFIIKFIVETLLKRSFTKNQNLCQMNHYLF